MRRQIAMTPQQVERIKSSANHQLGLVNELLTYTRLEAGREEARVVETDARRVVASSCPASRSHDHAMTTFQNYIDGKWVPAASGETFADIHPNVTGTEDSPFAPDTRQLDDRPCALSRPPELVADRRRLAGLGQRIAAQSEHGGAHRRRSFRQKAPQASP